MVVIGLVVRDGLMLVVTTTQYYYLASVGSYIRL